MVIKEVKKLWGREEWLVNTDLYCSKFLYLNKGYQCSLHFHKFKDETFYILEGEILLELAKNKMLNLEDADIEVYRLKKGQQINICTFQPHRFRAITNTAKILEVSTTHSDEDSYRLEKSKRTK